MGKVLLTAICLILFSQKTWAETVFYCSGTHIVDIENNKLQQFEPDNFKFTVNKNQIKYGNRGFMKNATIPVTRWFDETIWFAGTDDVTIKLNKGYYSLTGNFINKNGVNARVMTADCSKF
jgi:hypothetical protein